MIRILLFTALLIFQRERQAPATDPPCNNFAATKHKCKGVCAQKCDGKKEDSPTEEEKVAGMERCQHWSAQAPCECEGPCSHH